MSMRKCEHVWVWRAGSAVVAVMALLLLGCGGGDGPPADVVPTPLDMSTTGTINAVVSVDGTVPPPQMVNMRSTPACAAAHSEPVPDPSLRVRDGKLSDAIVWIKDGLGDRVFAPPKDPVVLNQRGCMYVPHVASVMVGQPLEFMNSDPESHNVHGKPSLGKGWNFMMSRPGSSRTLYLDKAEVPVPIGCDIHPWMQAYLGVFLHPYHGVTSDGGTTALSNVPPGDYVVAVWHQKLGTREQSVTLAPRGTVSVRFAYDAP
jgi:plastocyanin